jgi:hypothetical protein
MERLLSAGVPDLPNGALDPFLDYISEKIAAETAAELRSGTNAKDLVLPITHVPFPGTVSTNPSASSARMALRIVLREVS